MWQEARKQEKKIRGMMVDHKKVSICYYDKTVLEMWVNSGASLIGIYNHAVFSEG